ncbi:MAG: hypothetical protein HY608_00010 [Planctomycetes bacterium]|nr:hypothetical protein [Planctomycetota bacterium]
MKKRATLTLDRSVWKLAQDLAKRDRRSVSNLLEVLVEQEAERRRAKPKEGTR